MMQLRYAAERERIERCTALLRQSVRTPRPAPDFSRALEDAARGFAGHAIRDAAAWHPHMKTRDAARLRLGAARHLFARYPVASMLEHIWIDDTGLGPDEVWLRKRWYITVAGGGSLHKAGLCSMLSRKEVHAFLNPTPGLGFEGAFWEAIARSCTGDTAVALRIARSKIARMPRNEFDFWRSVARYFCTHMAPLQTMNDLCDYLADCRRQDSGFRIEGRSLRNLQRRMHEWHRDLATLQRIQALQRQYLDREGWASGSADAAWVGSCMGDWEWTPSPKEAEIPGESYLICQLKRAEDLVAEGRAMRHCVSTYASDCVQGQSSIWSLKRRVRDRFERLLTLELNASHQLVQVRGFANRSATEQEFLVLQRWMRDRNIQQGDESTWGF